MAATRILVVEDEAIIARSLVTRLTQLEYDVVGAVEDGTLAIEAARSTLPDLVLMDIVLQGEIDGIQAAKRIWQTLKIPVVYLTAYADPTTLERARQTSAFGYLLKPRWENNLHATVQIALQRAADERALVQDNQFLHREIEHRVKNNLQVISSLLRLQSSRATSPLISEALEESQNRIMAMATAHRNAYLRDNLNQVPLGDYVDELVGYLLQKSKNNRENVKYIRSPAPELAQMTLTLEQATPLSLIINEVVTNALDHGFDQGVRSGQICLELSYSPPEQLSLKIANNGLPLVNNFNSLTSQQKTQGVGLRLVDLLAAQLEGQYQLTTDAGWTTFSFIFPFQQP